MKRFLAACGAILFTVGTLIVPTMHHMAVWNETESSCTCCDHKADHSESDQPQQHHDSSTCSICQLAHMPMDTATAAIAPLHSLFVPDQQPAVLLPQPDLKPICILPFSCGPPGCRSKV